MSKRLQVVLDEAELERFQALASQSGTTLSEWARAALRRAERTASLGDGRAKLDAIRAATIHRHPAPDIDEMLAEIDRGASM